LPGGELGGLLEFREKTLNTAHNALGRIAMSLADAFNRQHRLGQDLNGEMGADYFTMGSPQVYPDDGGITVAITDVANLTTSDYRLDFDGTDYALTRLPENVSVAYTPGDTVDGISIDIDPLSPMAAGDSYIIQPTRS